ncbi:asparaginase [Acetobacter ghanensis]|uniref:asparaginase n=1 Tax=Acetobacter ghanensis TaxID=431306 RepID=UPI003D3479FE
MLSGPYCKQLLLAATLGLATTLPVPCVHAASPLQHNAIQTLPRVLVLATGGTISGKKDTRSAIGYDAGGVSGQELAEGVPGLDKLATLKVEQIANIGSQDMNDDVWLRLANRIQKAFDQHEADGVVITHGTDTMEETAFFLSNVIHTANPVVLTGSMRPSTAISADGPANLYEAVEVATSPKAKGRGVMMVMNDTIHGARWASKTNTTEVQTFRSVNAAPIGYVDPASIRFIEAALPQHGPTLRAPEHAPLPRVEIIYAHSNMDAQQIDNAIRDGAKGIVLAGVGDGNTSRLAIEGLDRAVTHGLLVVRSTRTGSGFVNRNVEVSDDQHGFAVSYDLNPQKARILLQLLIANQQTSPAEVQQAFAYADSATGSPE